MAFGSIPAELALLGHFHLLDTHRLALPVGHCWPRTCLVWVFSVSWSDYTEPELAAWWAGWLEDRSVDRLEVQLAVLSVVQLGARSEGRLAVLLVVRLVVLLAVRLAVLLAVRLAVRCIPVQPDR